MRLANIRAGDLVRIDDGMPYYAHVTALEPRALRVVPLGRVGQTYARRVTARQVVTHWRKAGRS